MSMVQVCLSYASDDQELVEDHLIGALTQSGIDVYYDGEMIGSSITWREHFDSELKKRRVCLVVWTDKSVDSHNVLSEYKTAFDVGEVVNIRVDDVKLPILPTDLSKNAHDVGDYPFIDLKSSEPLVTVPLIVGRVKKLKNNLKRRSISVYSIFFTLIMISFIVGFWAPHIKELWDKSKKGVTNNKTMPLTPKFIGGEANIQEGLNKLAKSVNESEPRQSKGLEINTTNERTISCTELRAHLIGFINTTDPSKKGVINEEFYIRYYIRIKCGIEYLVRRKI